MLRLGLRAPLVARNKKSEQKHLMEGKSIYMPPFKPAYSWSGPVWLNIAVQQIDKKMNK